MRQSKALLLATSLATSLAWEFPQTSSDGTYGLGPPPLWGNSKSAMSVQENINKTYGRLGAFQTTVPVHIGNDDWKFHVNTGQIEPYGVDTDVNNPLFVYTGYSVQTPSGSDLNSSIQSSEQLKGNQANGLCTRVPLGLFSSSVTNGYKQSDNGDCSNALGSDCTEALKNMGYGIPSGSDICSPSFVIPDECKSVFPDGGFGSARKSSLAGRCMWKLMCHVQPSFKPTNCRMKMIATPSHFGIHHCSPLLAASIFSRKGTDYTLSSLLELAMASRRILCVHDWSMRRLPVTLQQLLTLCRAFLAAIRFWDLEALS